MSKKNRERTWEATQKIARGLAEQVSARCQETLWLRDYPAATAGDVGRVVIGIARNGVHRSCAVVNDLETLVTIAVEAERKGAAALQSFRANAAGCKDAIEAMHAAIEASYGAASELDRQTGLAALAPSEAQALLSEPARQAAAAQAAAQAQRRRLQALGALSAETQRPGLLDVGHAVLDVLGQVLAVPEGRWRLELWGEGDPAAGAGITLAGGPHQWTYLVQMSAGQQGAVIRVRSGVIGGADHVLTSPTVSSLIAQLANVARLVRAAVDGRAGFRARPLTARRLAEQLAEALRGAQVATSLSVSGGSDEKFPAGWPVAHVVEHAGASEHWLATLQEGAQAAPPPSERTSWPNGDSGSGTESGPFVTITLGEQVVRLFSEAALADHLPALIAAAAAVIARLTPARLQLTHLYEVIEPFRELQRGLRLRYVACNSDPRGEVCEHRFHVVEAAASAASSGSPPIPTVVSLVDYSDDAILTALHRYLAPVLS